MTANLMKLINQEENYILHSYNILTQFFTDRTHRVCVDSCYSDWYSVHSGVPQGSILGPLLFDVYTSYLLQITSNPIYGYADDVTLVATAESPKSRLDVSACLNEDLRFISVNRIASDL